MSLVASLRGRLATVEAAVQGLARPRILVLEWTEPPFAPGHWVPEMVVCAGGVSAMGVVGEKSFRTTWDAAAASRPDVIVSAPCGFGLQTSVGLARELLDSGVLPDGVPLWAVDANASFARPGPRLIDGVEVLAAIAHPGFSGLPPPDADLARRLC